MKRTSTCFFVICLISIPCMANLNIALNKPAFATNEYSNDFCASKAVDGDVLTHWDAGYWANTIDNPHAESLTVDLQSIFNVNQINLWTLTGKPSAYPGYFVVYNLFSSTDNQSWNFIATGQLFDTTDPEDSIILNSVSMRYIRYDVVGGTHWANLHEMEVYGTPEPTTLALLGLGGLFLSRRKN